jgi:hypothetical protein
MSIQKMARGPVMLIDREFNIPLYNADKQMYVCINVSEIATSPGGKDYNIMLSEVKGLSYSVPERVDVNMFIPTTDANGELAHITMNDVDPKRGDIKLAQTLTPKENITTLAGLKEVLYNMAKTM